MARHTAILREDLEKEVENVAGLMIEIVNEAIRGKEVIKKAAHALDHVVDLINAQGADLEALINQKDFMIKNTINSAFWKNWE